MHADVIGGPSLYAWFCDVYRLHAELEELRKEGKKPTTDEKRNTEKFLSLALPPSHNAGSCRHVLHI